MQENAGACLVAFVKNCAISRFDRLGMIDYSCCNERKADVLKEPVLASLVADLKTRTHPTTQKPCLNNYNSIRCELCSSPGEGGRYFWGGPYGGEILICYGEVRGAQDVRAVILHELQHAAEACKNGNPPDCAALVCFEARAYFCSGTCQTPEECARQAKGSSFRHMLCPTQTEEQLIGIGMGCKLNKADCLVPRPQASDRKR